MTPFASDDVANQKHVSEDTETLVEIKIDKDNEDDERLMEERSLGIMYYRKIEKVIASTKIVRALSALGVLTT